MALQRSAIMRGCWCTHKRTQRGFPPSECRQASGQAAVGAGGEGEAHQGHKVLPVMGLRSTSKRALSAAGA